MSVPPSNTHRTQINIKECMLLQIISGTLPATEQGTVLSRSADPMIVFDN